MNHTENVMQAENHFSFSSFNKFSASIVSDETVIRVKRRANDIVLVMKNAVNNFLKTPEEIEAEFCLIKNSYGAVFSEQNSRTDSDDFQWKNRDGFLNIHTLEDAFRLSRDMEENY